MARKKKEEKVLDLELYTKSGKLRKRKKKTTRQYFTLETENAIVQYLQSDVLSERNRLFNEHINYSIHKLAENIIHTFKFYYTELDNVEDLKHEVVVFLLEKFHRYDQNQGRAYSFFGTIAKRYLIVYNENNYKKLKIRSPLEAVDEDKKVFSNIINQDSDKKLVAFVDSYVRYIDRHMEKIFTTPVEQSIATAVLEIFKRRENLDVFNKQQFYFYIREITGQGTPAITKVMKELKKIYKKLLNEEYIKGEIETDNVNIY